MILLLAEVLSPVNFYTQDSTNFCSINNKIDEHFKQLKFIKENSSLYDAVDAPLEYYSKCVSVLQCAWSMEFSQRFHLATELLLDADIKI